MPEKPEQCYFPQCKVRFALNKQLVTGGASKKPAKSLHLSCEVREIIAPFHRGDTEAQQVKAADWSRSRARSGRG